MKRILPVEIKGLGRYALAILAVLCILLPGTFVAKSQDFVKNPKHEMRAVWLATVYGIDWPSVTGTTDDVVRKQKDELCKMFDKFAAGGINAVMFQVRSMCDAMYPSSHEPWSAFLTGERGAKPAKGWNPLAFAVEEAHKRGMELHAWVNPFRLSNGVPPAPAISAAGKHRFAPQESGMVLSYVKETPSRKRKGKKTVRTVSRKTVASILDPGNAGAREHIVNVCREIVTCYDIDGLVFDDYFYPDGLPLGKDYDCEAWDKARMETGNPALTQAQWRRDNVNRTISEISHMVNEVKPWVRFGVSPAGVGGGNGVATAPYGFAPPAVGSDWMFDRIFCDPVAWLAAGTVDYVSPQIYWDSQHATNPYGPLAMWWNETASRFGRHCFPSQKVLALEAGPEAWREQELQVKTNRAGSSPAGSVFYSSAHMTGKKASGLLEYLSGNVFSTKALMPAMKWKFHEKMSAPAEVKYTRGKITWQKLPGMRYAVYAIPEELDVMDVLSEEDVNFDSEYLAGVSYGDSFNVPETLKNGYRYAVAAYDRFGNEGPAQMAVSE